MLPGIQTSIADTMAFVGAVTAAKSPKSIRQWGGGSVPPHIPKSPSDISLNTGIPGVWLDW